MAVFNAIKPKFLYLFIYLQHSCSIFKNTQPKPFTTVLNIFLNFVLVIFFWQNHILSLFKLVSKRFGVLKFFRSFSSPHLFTFYWEAVRTFMLIWSDSTHTGFLDKMECSSLRLADSPALTNSFQSLSSLVHSLSNYLTQELTLLCSFLYVVHFFRFLHFQLSHTAINLDNLFQVWGKMCKHVKKK